MGHGRAPRALRAWVAGLGSILGLATCATSLAAHDVWLEPSTFRARPGETVSIDVLVGEDFAGEAVPRRGSRIADFWFGDGRSRRPVRGLEGVAPAGVIKTTDGDSGYRMVHYESRPLEIDLSRQRFESHLRAEGLAALVDARPDRPGSVHETYSRCVAAVIAVGTPRALPEGAADCDLSVWPVELPAASGGPVGLEVRFLGKPIGDALVRAYRRGEPEMRFEARSDSRGRLKLLGLEPGVWLVKTLHVVRLDDGEWRSWWSSLTFELTRD